MTATLLISAGLAFFAFSLLAKRLSGTIVTGPMLFLLLGWGLASIGGAHLDVAEPGLHLLAEITLVIVLFADATMVDVRTLRHHHVWPARMLTTGLPLAVILGTALGLFILDWPLWEVALIAAILTPTDAALGQAVVANTGVPGRVRRALVVESGLNDGLALPLILFIGCVAVGGVHDFVQTSWLRYAAEQIGIGAATGATVGWLGCRALEQARRSHLSTEAFEGVGILALAGICYFSAVALGGNGFLAAFAGGLGYALARSEPGTYLTDFMETEGTLLVLATFLIVGLTLVPDAIASFEPWMVPLIVMSLLIVRPAAIYLSLAGTDASPKTRLFLGWFGPRGLATVLFALLIVGQLGTLPHAHEILTISTLTVLASAILHGLTAAPVAARFGGTLLAGRETHGLVKDA